MRVLLSWGARTLNDTPWPLRRSDYLSSNPECARCSGPCEWLPPRGAGHLVLLLCGRQLSLHVQRRSLSRQPTNERSCAGPQFTRGCLAGASCGGVSCLPLLFARVLRRQTLRSIAFIARMYNPSMPVAYPGAPYGAQPAVSAVPFNGDINVGGQACHTTLRCLTLTGIGLLSAGARALHQVRRREQVSVC